MLQAQLREENEQVNVRAHFDPYMSPYGVPPPPQNAKQPANVSSPRSAPVRKDTQLTSGKPLDMMSRSQQRQIFSMISGMQGGISNLQKQLDSFKALLGIDEDDDD